jgi:hypothetical protein
MQRGNNWSSRVTIRAHSHCRKTGQKIQWKNLTLLSAAARAAAGTRFCSLYLQGLTTRVHLCLMCFRIPVSKILIMIQTRYSEKANNTSKYDVFNPFPHSHVSLQHRFPKSLHTGVLLQLCPLLHEHGHLAALVYASAVRRGRGFPHDTCPPQPLVTLQP